MINQTKKPTYPYNADAFKIASALVHIRNAVQSTNAAHQELGTTEFCDYFGENIQLHDLQTQLQCVADFLDSEIRLLMMPEEDQ
jgi:hypothetical protein